MGSVFFIAHKDHKMLTVEDWDTRTQSMKHAGHELLMRNRRGKRRLNAERIPPLLSRRGRIQYTTPSLRDTPPWQEGKEFTRF